MIDKSFIGLDLGSHEVQPEKGALKFFAKAIGQENPVFFNEAAAAEAGYPGLPVPPTYYFSMDLLQDEPFKYFETLGINIAHVLHGTQDFEYFKPAFAGDTVILKAVIKDIYDKKNGALEFVIKEVRAENKAGELLARQIMTVVVRNPKKGA
ncbi:FAS1-like dehydratase domain-containing protein [Emcibacter sp.]|uniref:FAS1-like dehydratase domain-containing protein n=1 Tax=Emcibacter sp. TaxID=1979954 RepID=UPI003A8D3A06